MVSCCGYALIISITVISCMNFEVLWVILPFAVGSALFLLASSMMLFMWKNQQYGLGFVRGINRLSVRR